MAAQIACLNQLPRMAADRNSTYTTSFDFHCILQAKNARLLFACSCELARVYMRPFPTSCSRVHATFVSRVHATPRPALVRLFMQRPKLRRNSWQSHLFAWTPGPGCENVNVSTACVSSWCTGHATVFQRLSATRNLSHSSSACWSFKSPCCHNFLTANARGQRGSQKILCAESCIWFLQFCISPELYFAMSLFGIVVACWASKVSIVVTGSCSHSRASKPKQSSCPKWAVKSWSGKHLRRTCTWLLLHH